MKHRNRKLIICTLLALSMLISLLPSTAFGVTQSDIDALKAERDQISAEREKQQAVVDELAEKQATVLERKQALDDRNAYTIKQIRLTDDAIEMYSELIEEKSHEVDAARAKEDEQLRKYRSRIRAMEENGTLNYISLILKANNLGELLTAIDDIGEIMASDKALEKQYVAAREYTEKTMSEYEDYKAEQEEHQAELQEEKAKLEAELAEAEQLILEITKNLDKESDELTQIEQAVDEANANIDALVKKLEEEKAAAAQAAAVSAGGAAGSGYTGTVVGSGSFSWPVSCTYITSCVGYRYHPVSGEWKYHSGMDVGCSYGDSVWASDSGTVSLAGVNGGYGNCVMIDHGNGYYTLYGHLSSIACSYGQAVSKGQTIGYVGSTGVSTGPHLHFEIREGSNCLDFSSWFSGLTYAPDSGG